MSGSDDGPRWNAATAGSRPPSWASVWIAALFLIAASIVAVPTSAEAQTTITRIEIAGAQRIEDETIRSYLQIAEGDVVDAVDVNEALKRLFATGLFQDARISPQADGVLLVEVIENPIINRISFEGNREIEDDVLQAQIRSRPRGAFTRSRAESDAQAILDIYRASGRFAATVEPLIIERDANRVDLVFEINEGASVGVSAINFVGNTEYSDGRLRRVIETTETAWWKVLATSDNYNPDRLELDKELLRRFYFSRGYADFEVLSAVAELSPERDGFFITFTVAEGERYDVGEVSIRSDANGVEPEIFEDLIDTDTGDTYDADLVERSVRRMLERAGREGVNFVDIRPQARRRPAEAEGGPPIIDLAYVITDAPRIYVERIEIEGNVRTLDRVIRREFEFVEGDAFNAFKLQQSRANIQQLNFFSSTEVTTERGSSDDRVVVRAAVEEKSTGDISFGLGFSTADSIGGQISLTERNFLGRGQFVRASFSITSSRQFFDFRFTEPYFLGRNLRAGFDIFYTEVENEDSDFTTTQAGFSPRVGFPIDENSRVDFAYLIKQQEITEVENTTSPLVAIEGGESLTSQIGYDYVLDLRNDASQPTRGFILRLGQDFSGLGGDERFIKSEASVKGFTSFFREEVIVSLELEGGAVFGLGEDVGVSNRFFLGGDSLRGFENGGVGPRDTNVIDPFDGTVGNATALDTTVGGNYFGVVRADVSFPLGLPEEWGIFGGVFADAGTLWGLDSASYLDESGNRFSVDDGLELRAAAGASIFWTSPFGPLRFNFALPLIEEDTDKTENFRFSAGTRF